MCTVCGALNGHLTRIAAEAAHDAQAQGDAAGAITINQVARAKAEAVAAAKTSLTGQALVDQITRTNLEWADTESVPLTYAFAATGTGNFARLDANQIAASEKALSLWAEVANVTFERVGTGTAGEAAYSNDATILFNTLTSHPAYAYGYFPGDRAKDSLAGDIFLNTSGTAFDNLALGSYDFMTVLHEIGHALGLSHPSVYSAGQTYAATASYREDSRTHTVMSYFSAEDSGGAHGQNYATTPMIHDILAAQTLYGANMTTRTGDTVYGFNTNAGESYSITGSSDAAVFAIWDAGGNDTLDFSGYDADQKISLGDGTLSDTGGLIQNIGIAFNAIIENAIGGSGKDTIIGNGVDNILSGGAGDDWLTGGAGSDTLWGGAGKDRFVFNSMDGVDRIESFSVPGDTLVFDNAVFSSLWRDGSIKKSWFKSLNGQNGPDKNDYIQYDRKTGDLYYDADGGRAGSDRVLIAELNAGLKLSWKDFLVI
jgi:serralysin